MGQKIITISERSLQLPEKGKFRVARILPEDPFVLINFSGLAGENLGVIDHRLETIQVAREFDSLLPLVFYYPDHPRSALLLEVIQKPAEILIGKGHNHDPLVILYPIGTFFPVAWRERESFLFPQPLSI